MASASGTKLLAHSSPRRDPWPWGILILALAVRAAYFLAYQQSPYWGVELADQSYYRNWGMRIAHGDWLGSQVFEQGPFYAYLLGFAYRLGLNDGVILALQLLAGSSVALLVYACGRRLFDLTTARVAAVITAIYGPLVHYECMLMKSFLSPVLTMLACYGALRFTEGGRRRWLVVAGASIGLACLLTENHILLLIPVAVWCWTGGWPGQSGACPGTNSETDRQSFRQHIGALAILAASCALTIFPATVRNYLVARELVAVTSGGGEVFFMAWGPFATGNYQPPDFVRSNPYLEHQDFRREARRRTGRELTRGESSRYWFSQGRRAISADPPRALRLTGLKAVILFNDFEVPDSEHFQVAREFIPLLYVLPTFGWLVGLGFVGVVVCLRDWKRYQLPLGMCAMHVLSILITYNFGRFRLGMTPLWILFAAAGVVWLVRSWRGETKSQSSRRLIATLAAVALTMLAFFPSPGISRDVLAAETQKNRETLLTMSRTLAEAEPFRAQLTAQPRDFKTHLMLGVAYKSVGKLFEAVEQLSAAVQIDGTSAQARCLLADALQQTGRIDEAITELLNASTLQSDSPDVVAATTALVDQQEETLNVDQAKSAASILERAADRSAELSKFDQAANIAHDAIRTAARADDPQTIARLQRKESAWKRGRKLENGR